MFSKGLGSFGEDSFVLSKGFIVDYPKDISNGCDMADLEVI